MNALKNASPFPFYWLNNRIKHLDEPAFSPFERGLTLSDGIFETIRRADGKTASLSDHLERFEKGCRLLHLPLIPRETLQHAIKEILNANSVPKNATIRLTYSRGPGNLVGGRGLTPPHTPCPTLFLTLSPASPTLLEPISLFISQKYKRDADSPLHRIKSLAMLPSLLARYEAQEQDADDALFCNYQDYLTESTCANFLFIKEKQLYTPPHHHGLLEGISRKKLLKEAFCQEKPLKKDEIHKIQSAWLVTSLSLTPISKINGIPLQRNLEQEGKILSLLYKSSI